MTGMANEHEVLSGKNMPIRLPWQFTIVIYLLLDRFHVAGWVWGVFGTLLGIVWVVSIYALCVQKNVTIEELRGHKPKAGF